MKKLLLNFRTLAASFLFLCLFLTTESFGQVTTVQNWSNLYNNTSTSSQSVSYPVATGSNTNRVLAVAIASSQTAVGARTVTITYGGQTMTLAAGNMGTTTTRQHTAIYYLNDAGLDAASNSNLVFTVSGGTTRVTTVWAALFDYVDQTTPTTNTQNYNSIATAADPFVFGTTLTINNSDQAVLAISSVRAGNTTPRNLTMPTNFTLADDQTWTTTDGVVNAIANRSVPISNTSSTCSTAISGTGGTLGSMTGVSFKGCVPATANAGSALTAICQGGTSAGLGGSVGGSATGGTWSSSAGGTFAPNATNLNATWTPPAGYSGTATLTLTSSGGSCGVDTASKTIVVNPAPSSVTANASSSSICAGGSINLTSSATSNSALSATLINENFNGAGTPSGWTNITNSGTGGTPSIANWAPQANGYVYDSKTFSSNDASQFFMTNSDAQGNGSTTVTILQSPAFSTIGANTASLTFYHHYRFNSGTDDRGFVEVSTDGTNWNSPSLTYSASTGSYNSFLIATLNLSAYLNQATVYIRFRYTASWDWYWAIDNVSVAATYLTPPPPAYAWTSTPSGYTSSTQNPTGVSPTVNTSYTVTATNNNGCAASATTSTVTVNPTVAASVSIAASPSSTICSGTNVTFTATPTNGGTPSYQWKLNGSNVGTNSPTYSNNALANGNTVSVVMTSTATCATGSPATSNTVTMTVNPSVAASVSIAASPSSTICSGTNVTFTATPTNGGTPSYQWKLNGSNVGTNSPTYSNNALANGNTVSVEMTSNATCATGSPATSNTVTMTVNPNVAASVSIAASPSSTICSGTNVTFTATPTNGGTPSYQWKLNGSNVGTNSATYSNNALANGNTVSVVMTSNATCVTGTPATSNTVTMTVNPNVAASVSIAASPSSTICAGTNVTFTATPTNGGTPSYQWKLNGGNVGTNSPTYSNNALVNTDAVSVVMTSTATCATGSPATSNTVTMTVNPNLAASVSIAPSPSSTICSGTNVTFTATPTNGGTPSYQWKLNGGNVGTNSPTYSNNALANGNTVSVVMTSNATCVTGSPATSNTVTMTVNPNLASGVSIAPSPSSTICSGTNVTFTATPTNGGTPSYQWKLNGGNVGTNSPTYSNNALANGNTVSVVMTSTATCATGSPATSNTVTMTVNTGSTAASISGTATICSGSSTNLQVAITGGLSPYAVVYTSGSVSGYISGSNISVSPTSTTNYTITSVTDSNGCIGTGNTGSATVTLNSTSSSDGVTWSNGAPSGTVDAILTGGSTIVLGADLNACSLTVNGPAVSVTSGFNIDLNGALRVTSGSFTLNNNSNLIQHNSGYTNSGNIIVKRNSAAIKRLDYTLWSTPVTGQGLYAFSKFTLPNRFYVYDSSNDTYSNTVGFNLTGLQYPSPLVAPNGVNGTDTNNIQFAAGKGYLVRVPYDHPTTPTVYAGTFTGVPNTGNVTLSGLTSGLYYAIGNPYPSTIDADQFIVDNSIGDNPLTPGDGLYFWRKTNNAAAASYATYTTAGGVASGGDTSVVPIVPNGVIQVGEGFIVKSTSSSIGFNNNQRIANNGGQFLRTLDIERNRIWVNLSDASGNVNQMMVSYMTGASQDIDAAIDGRFFNDNPTALNSLLNNEEFAIQGRSLPFEVSDVVPLAFKSASPGNFTIAIDHVDGLFTAGTQVIYLKDNLTTTVHNLSTGAYTFATAAGTFNNRFEIVYQPQLANPIFTANAVVIYTQGNGFVVNSGNFVMSSIKVFDIRGRLIEENKAINANEATINGGLANEVLLVQITTEDGVTVTKKVIK